MKIYIALYFLFLLFGYSNANEGAELMSESDAKKLPIKKLRSLLSDRGLECKGCAEKEDFVRMFVQNQHLPILETRQSPPASKDPSDLPLNKDKDKQMEEVFSD